MINDDCSTLYPLPYLIRIAVIGISWRDVFGRTDMKRLGHARIAGVGSGGGAGGILVRRRSSHGATGVLFGQDLLGLGSSVL